MGYTCKKGNLLHRTITVTSENSHGTGAQRKPLYRWCILAMEDKTSDTHEARRMYSACL